MQEISGTTRLVGILGWPVEHSLSPRMHNAAFEALGLDWAYVALPTAPERLEEAVRGLEAARVCRSERDDAAQVHGQGLLRDRRAVREHARDP